MNKSIFRRVLWMCGLYLVSVTLAPASLIQDGFSGTSVNTNIWGTAFTGGASAPSQADGKLTTQVTTTSQNQRTLLHSLRTDLDFFAQPLTMSADIASLGGTGSELRPVNRYLLIGSFGTNTETLSQYYPGSELRFGVWLSAGQTNGVNYLEVGTVRIGNVTTTREVYTGTLSSMSIVLDGTSYSVSATGTDGFSVGIANSFSGTLANVIASEYNDHFRFAMGAANSHLGSVTAGASAEWDSVSVIPEPGTLGLTAMALGVLSLCRYKLNRSRRNVARVS